MLIHLDLNHLCTLIQSFLFSVCPWENMGYLGPNLTSLGMHCTFAKVKALSSLQELCKGYLTLTPSCSLHNSRRQCPILPTRTTYYVVLTNNPSRLNCELCSSNPQSTSLDYTLLSSYQQQASLAAGIAQFVVPNDSFPAPRSQYCIIFPISHHFIA